MASEIRVDKINSLSGVGTVTLSPTGVDIAGITTAATLRATTGIVTSLTAGSLTSIGNVAVSGANITLQDSDGASDDRLILGTGSDLQLYHDGSNSYVHHQSGATGNLLIYSEGHEIQLIPKSGEAGVKVINDGAVELYHNGTKTIETTSTGSDFVGISSIRGTTGTSAGGLLDITVTTGDNFIKFKNAGNSTNWAVGNDSTTRDKFDFWYDGGSGYSAPGLRIQEAGILAGNNTLYPTTGYGYHNWGCKSQILHDQGLSIQRSANSDTWGGGLILAASNGTYQTPTAVSQNDKVGGIYFCSHDGTDFSNYSAAIETYIDDGVASNDTPGRIVFSTAANGSNQLTQRVVIHKGGVTSFNDGIELGSGLDATAANTLDDYEYGNWSPAINSGGFNIDSVYYSKYVKIGKIVHLQYYVNLAGSGNNNALIFQGLPFAVATNGYATGTADFGKGSIKGTYSRTESNTSHLYFLYPSENTSANRVILAGSQVGSGYAIGQITYYTDN